MHEVLIHKPTRVLHVGPGWGQRGGIASVLNELRMLDTFFAAQGVNLRFCETHGSKRIGGMLRFVASDIPRFVQQLAAGVDIVHLHVSIKGSFYRKLALFMIARALRRKVVFHLHAGNFSSFISGSKQIVAWAARAFLRGSRTAVGVSTALGEELVALGADPARLFIIGNSASAAEHTDLLGNVSEAAHSPRILFAGRLADTKGIGELLQALAILAARGAEATLVVAGTGDERRWRDEAKRLAIDDRVIFAGWLEGDEKLACYRSAQIFCMPSHYEAFGIATLEAMFAGLPIVGTRVGGFPDLVDDGDSGFLVEPSNPDELAQALGKLVTNASLAARMGRTARERALARFSCGAIVKRYVEMYSKTMAAR